MDFTEELEENTSPLSVPPTAAVDPISLSQVETPEPVEDDRSLIGEAIKESWVVGSEEDVERLFTQYEDTGYKMSDEEFMALPNSYDDDQLEALRDVSSEEERDALRSEFDEKNERTEWLASQGIAGASAQIGATLLDPVLWGAVATAEVGGATILASRAARMGRIARGLTTATAAEAGIAAVRSQTESDYSTRDMAIDYMTALVATGVIDGALALKAGEFTKEATDDIVREATGQTPGQPKDGGAAAREFDKERLRIDEYAWGINTENPEVQSWTQLHLQDPVSGGSDSTAVVAQRLRDNYQAKANASFEELWKTHKEKGGGSIWNAVENARQRQILSQQVWEARVLGVDHGPEVSKVAQDLGTTYDEILNEAKRHELAGFENIESDPTYMRQSWRGDAWSAIERELGAEGQKDMTALIEEGLYGFDDIDIRQTLNDLTAQMNALKGKEQGEQLRKLQDEVDELVAIRDARTELAIGFTNRMLSRADGQFRSIDELLEDEALLKDWLKENPNHKFKSEEYLEETIRRAVNKKTAKSGDVVDRAKSRIRINPNASIKASNGREIFVHELMEKDAMRLHQGYVNSMSGHIAFAKNGVKRPSDWQAERDSMFASEVKRLGGGDEAQRQAREMVERVERSRAEIYGQPRHDTANHTGYRLASLLMKWNFMTAMGKASFAALSEMGRILGENGVRNTIRTISSLDGLFTDSFRTINKNPTIVKEVNDFNGSIGDEYLVRLFNSYDETGILEGTATAGFLNKSEIIAHRGAQIMSKASFLAPVDKALRLLSFSSSTNSLYRHLVLGKGSRLAFTQMGLTKDVLEDIAKNMRSHTSVNKLGSVTKLGIEKWDRKTADAFMNAMTTNGARQVQKALAGESADFMSHPFFRPFLQFRAFTLNAYAKHLRADIRDMTNDPLRVALSTSFATMMALMSYYARTVGQSVGMDDSDREAFLEERLATERVVANALNYTPNLGIGVTLNNMSFGHFGDAFEIPVSRTTGLGNTSIGGNPSADKLNLIASALHNINENDTSAPVRSVRPLIPGQNTLFGDLIFNPLESAVDE